MSGLDVEMESNKRGRGRSEEGRRAGRHTCRTNTQPTVCVFLINMTIIIIVVGCHLSILLLSNHGPDCYSIAVRDVHRMAVNEFYQPRTNSMGPAVVPMGD